MSELAGPPLGALTQVPSDIAKLLVDPAVNEALSPAQGLQVTPHVFTAIEQEGRWKHENWGFYPQGRELTNDLVGQAPKAGTMPQVPAPAAEDTLLVVTINKLSIPDQILLGIGATIAVPLAGSALVPLINASAAGDDNVATITVKWWADKNEIWGGVAGLASAQGFGSVYGHRAKIDVTGIPFGNYFPARYLIMASGWLNPLGPQYYEFRCGAVAKAGETRLTPLFGELWDRGGNAKQLRPGVGTRYNILVKSWASTTSLAKGTG